MRGWVICNVIQEQVSERMVHNAPLTIGRGSVYQLKAAAGIALSNGLHGKRCSFPLLVIDALVIPSFTFNLILLYVM